MIVLRLPADTPDLVIEHVLLAAKRFPGEHALELRIPTRRGMRRLTFGPEWRYSGDLACLAALREFGAVEVSDA